MNSPLAFFSFVSLGPGATPSDHRAYNEWHQLDHRPENLALPGVAWGDRWALDPTCRAVATAAPEYESVDYVAMYWFRDPLAESLRAWDELGGDSFQWGRGPLLPGVRRPLLSFFRPVLGYAAPSALVAPAVIPYRPNRGLHLTLSRHAEPQSAGTHEHYRWQDRDLIPALLGVPGVAGAWTFSFDHHQQHASLPLSTDTPDRRGGLRVRLLYLDEDPIATTEQVQAATQESLDHLPPDARESEEVLLSTPLRTIIPWQDW